MCVWHRGLKRAQKEKKRQGHDKYSVLKGCELAQTLGIGTMHGGMAVPRSLQIETEAAWGRSSVSVGPQRKTGGRPDQKQRGKLRQIFLQVLR